MLPDVPEGLDYANLGVEAEAKVQAAGYIIGKLQRVIFYAPGVKETNWSATRVVKGVDGIDRRWVYLHYFKAGQPSINWLDPSFAGMRLVIGDALHSLADLGSGALRLDANGFLGVEKSAEDRPAWSEGHPLSEAANQLIASMVRKMGGFSFQELNLTMDDIKTMGESGSDLSYDFVNRPAYHHALSTGDTEFLRLTMNQALALGIDSASLVHALRTTTTHPRSSTSPRATATTSLPTAARRSPAETSPSASAPISPPPSPDPTSRTTGPSPPTASPAPPPRRSARSSASRTPTRCRTTTSSGSSACTCCWRCTTPSSPACSRCQGGTWWAC
jgi:hypothetical protein